MNPEKIFTLAYGNGKQTSVECLAVSNFDSLVNHRCQFIAGHQQFIKPGDPEAVPSLFMTTIPNPFTSTEKAAANALTATKPEKGWLWGFCWLYNTNVLPTKN